MARGDLQLSQRDRGLAARDRIVQRYQTARTFIRTCGAVAAVYVAREFIVSLSGKDTLVALKLSFLGDFKFALSIGLAGSAAVWAIAERILRQRKVEKMQARITELERQIDPKRSSSGLTTKGKTNPKDKAP